MTVKKTILCIDDNEDTRNLIGFFFRKSGFDVVTCQMPEDGISYARANDYAVIISDFYLKGMDGTDLCRAVRAFDSEKPIIFLTGEGREDYKKAAFAAGAQAYVVKPADLGELHKIVTDLI